jgi:ribosomal protein L12E/L44/L45/RPP1/RPP2
MLDRLDGLRTDEMKELIQQSYEMVAAKAPRAARRKKGAKTKAKNPLTKKPRLSSERKQRSRTKRDQG